MKAMPIAPFLTTMRTSSRSGILLIKDIICKDIILRLRNIILSSLVTQKEQEPVTQKVSFHRVVDVKHEEEIRQFVTLNLTPILSR